MKTADGKRTPTGFPPRAAREAALFLCFLNAVIPCEAYGQERYLSVHPNTAYASSERITLISETGMGGLKIYLPFGDIWVPTFLRSRSRTVLRVMEQVELSVTDGGVARRTLVAGWRNEPTRDGRAVVDLRVGEPSGRLEWFEWTSEPAICEESISAMPWTLFESPISSFVRAHLEENDVLNIWCSTVEPRLHDSSNELFLHPRQVWVLF